MLVSKLRARIKAVVKFCTHPSRIATHVRQAVHLQAVLNFHNCETCRMGAVQGVTSTKGRFGSIGWSRAHLALWSAAWPRPSLQTLQHEDAPPDLLMDEPADNPIPFGFGNNPHEESIQSDEGENSTDSGGSDVSSPPKKRKGTSKAHQTAKKVQVEEPLEAGAKKGKLQANIPYINILAEQQCRMSRTWRLCWHRS